MYDSIEYITNRADRVIVDQFRLLPIWLLTKYLAKFKQIEI